MLHLQLASNIATAIGVTPTYTGPALQNADHGWICYGPTLTVIPYIIDLKDTKEHKDVGVNIGPVSEDQLKLFLAIEEPEKVATTSTPTSSTNTSRSHPSSIGGRNNRCQCSARSAGCTSATRTISKSNTATAARCGRRCTALARRKARSRTTCSTSSSPAANPMREFMGFESTVALTYPDIAKQQIVQMMIGAIAGVTVLNDYWNAEKQA